MARRGGMGAALGLALCLALHIVPAGAGAAEPVAGATVHVLPMTFEPARVTIHAGESVTWENASPVAHEIRFDGKNPTTSPGAFTLTRVLGMKPVILVFPHAGTFTYNCSWHHSSGTVEVTAPEGATADNPKKGK